MKDNKIQLCTNEYRAFHAKHNYIALAEFYENNRTHTKTPYALKTRAFYSIVDLANPQLGLKIAMGDLY